MKKRVCGLDVHKDTIFCAVYDGQKKYPVKEYTTFTENIQQLAEELKKLGVQEIAMESTGHYWIPVWDILEDKGFSLKLVNPLHIKQMPGRKSDVKDAQWIAMLLHKGLLRSSLIPDKTIRQLRTYSRGYVELQRELTRVYTKMERFLEMSNIRITSLVSNISGKSVIKVIKKIIDKQDDPQELMSCIHNRIANKHKENVRKALNGRIEEHHRFMLRQAYERYELLMRQLQELEEQMLRLCEEHYQEHLKLLRTIPGVNTHAAIQIVAETGADMNAFDNSGKLTGWAGLRPRNDESAGKMKSTAITKGNKYLRRIMVQVAWAASRMKGTHPHEQFIKLSIRKSRKKALIAIARKQLSVVWNILRYRQPYNMDKQPVYKPQDIKRKLHYHQKQVERLQSLCS